MALGAFGVAGALALATWTIGCCGLSVSGHRGPVSDHFDGEKFFHPWRKGPQAGTFDFVKWQANRPESHWPEYRDEPYGPPPPARLEPGKLRVTFVNHATVLVQAGTVNVLSDPIWSERASPFGFAGPRRVRPPGIRFEDLPPIDLVVLSHNHYDHMDLETLERLYLRDKPRFVVGLGNAEPLAKQGIQDIVELDWWQAAKVGDLEVVSAPSQHFSNRGMCDSNKALWSAFVVRAKEGNVYFGGDTGYGPHFAMAREKLGSMRLAILPIGAFEPEWFMGVVHMTPEEALRAHRDLGAYASVGMHFGTFELADDDFDEPPKRIEEGLKKGLGGKRPFWVLGFGEGRDVE